MKRVGWLISRHLLSTILPYFAFAWLLLSAILFVQQAGKFSDIFFNLNIPSEFIWQLALALIPNVISFTCPMAILVATIIGIAKMRGDSELVAVRAAGVGNLQLAVPVILLGAVLSAFAFFVNLKGVPVAAGLVRNVALQSAIKKLESPVEPGVFNSEVSGYTIYVEEGDKESGVWRNIFIFKEDAKTGTVTLITSQAGRMDMTDQLTELVLTDAKVVTLPTKEKIELVSENISELRIAIQTKRGELLDRLTNGSAMPEELGLAELSTYANTLEGKQKTEAEILLQRRITLSIAPLLFCLLGFAISLRFNRGGRGAGSLLALGVLIGYYLIAFGSEQLARTGALPVAISGLIPILAALLLIVWFLASSRFSALTFNLFDGSKFFPNAFRNRSPLENKPRNRDVFVDLTTGLRDMDMALNLGKYFVLSVIFLAAVFLIFTAFELWKFVGAINGGTVLLLKYLAFLMPYIYLQLAPTATLIAILALLITKSRNHEFVTWAAAGQSAYRLLAPCLIFALIVGAASFGIQELVSPYTNKVQDSLRLQIRRGGAETSDGPRTWVASGNRVYSYATGEAKARAVIEPASDNERRFTLADVEGSAVSVGKRSESDNASSMNFGVNSISDIGRLKVSASDNERALTKRRSKERSDLSRPGTASDNEKGRGSGRFGTVHFVPGMIFPIATFQYSAKSASDNERGVAACDRCVRDLVIYEFDNEGTRLQTVYRGNSARWEFGRVKFVGEVEKTTIDGVGSTVSRSSGGELTDDVDPFAEAIGRPAHLTLQGLKKRLADSDSDTERASFGVAVEKRYSTILIPFIIALFAAPLALSLTGKGNIANIAYAIGCWLLFLGTSSVFSQFGDSGQLAPEAAIWFPIVIFALIGAYLFSRVRT